MLGEQVRNIRKKRGITLKELAEKTGLSIGYISQIERNLTDPSLSTLRKLSAALDIPTYLFMGGESSTGLTTRQADMMILSQPNSNIRYHLLTPMPNGDFVPQSLVIRFELEPHCKDGDLPVIHPSEEILLLEQGQLDPSKSTKGSSIYCWSMFPSPCGILLIQQEENKLSILVLKCSAK